MIGNRFTHAVGFSIITLSLLFLSAIPRDASAQTGEIIVDQNDPNTSSIGRWQTTGGWDPYADSSVFSKDSRSRFTWHPALTATGSYKVFAWWTYHRNRSSNVPYRIEHDGGVTIVEVDQSKESLGSRWQLLGTYEFTPGVNGNITVSAENGQASADAVRFVPVQTNSDDPAADSTDVTGTTPDVTGTTPDDTGSGSDDTGTSMPVNSAPVISGTPQTTVMVDTDYFFVPDASDADGDVLTFDITNKPGWAEFDPATGALSGKPGSGDVGTYSWIDIVVTDGQETVGLMPFTIDVQMPAIKSITLNWQPPTENTDGSALTDLDSYYISYGTDPSAMTHRIDIPNEGLTSFVVDNLSPAVWYFELFAVNAQGVSSDPSNLLTADLR